MSHSSITLSNARLSVTILPEVAGKISSLRDLSTGKEWLWSNPHLKPRKPVYGESYIENIDFGGWDEIFPSVAPCTLTDGTEIPDHGDLVFMTPEIEEHTETSLRLRWTTRCYSCQFTRHIDLLDEVLSVDYQLKSCSQTSLPYLWAAHPLIALEDGMILELPSNDLDILGEDKKLTDLLEHENSGESYRFSISDPDLTQSSPQASKIFSQANEVDWLTLHRQKGGSLSIRWHSAENPYLGIWLNQRGWSGCGSAPYFNMGLEPTTAPYDDLNDAIAQNQHRILEPKAIHQWAMQISLTSLQQPPLNF